MVSKEQEYRGIPLSALGSYFEELGARKQTEAFPYTYQSNQWRAEILHEKMITFTSVIQVNSVLIRFTADNDEIMGQLLKCYSYKTLRAGG